MGDSNKLTKKQFLGLLRGIEKHSLEGACLDSSGSSQRDCDAYRTLVAHGENALSHIRDALNGKYDDQLQHGLDSWTLTHAVVEITKGRLTFPPEMAGRMEQQRVYAADWLERNAPAEAL